MLTKDEAELYDRQIRLWGVNAQTKLRQSKVLMLGFNGVASEVAKILVLAGIDTLTIVDDEPLSQSDLSSNLFCRNESPNNKYRTHAVQEKLRVLNPLVKVDIINEPITSEKVKTELISSHDFVSLHTFLQLNEIFSINDKCRSHGVKFYIAIDFGYLGFMFNDLGDKFEFTHEEFEATIQQTTVNKNNSGEAVTVSDDNDDSSSGDNDDSGLAGDQDDEKPRKRQRVRSPVRNGGTDKDAKRQRIESLKYCSFEEMLKLDNCQFSRRTSPVLIVSVAMFKFYDKFKHLPKDADEWSEFDKTLEQLKEATQVQDNFKRLDPEWRDTIGSSLSSVCAVLGGVAGQDMIRALSTKDIPILNTFSFDGLNMNGIVEKVGIGEAKADKVIKPVVRDLIELESDGDDVEAE